MQLAITGTKFLIFQEERVVQQSQSIEDIELVLLSENERVVHEFVETLLKICAGVLRREGVLGGVVEEVGCADVLVVCVVNDRGFENVEGEEVS